jgi:hypothetical protein
LGSLAGISSDRAGANICAFSAFLQGTRLGSSGAAKFAALEGGSMANWKIETKPIEAIDPDAESITLISREIFESLPDGFNLISRGTHLVKGKNDGLKVDQLVGKPKGVASHTA